MSPIPHGTHPRSPSGLPPGSRWATFAPADRDPFRLLAALLGLHPATDAQRVDALVPDAVATLARLRESVCHAIGLPGPAACIAHNESPMTDEEIVAYVFDLWGRHNDLTRHTFALEELWPDALDGVSFPGSLDVASDNFAHLIQITVARVREMRRMEGEMRRRMIALDLARRAYNDALAGVAGLGSEVRAPVPPAVRRPPPPTGQNLAAWIRARSMTQLQAAQLLGVTQSAISKWAGATDKALPIGIAAALRALDARRTA